LKAACDAVETTDYTIGVMLPLVKDLPAILSVMVFLVCMLLSFGLGTSSIISPIALPLVLVATGNDLNWIVYATVGAVLSESIFGDHCSPIEDKQYFGTDSQRNRPERFPFPSAGKSQVFISLVC